MIPLLVGTLDGVGIDVGLIPAAASYPLRQAVLRPHQRIDEVGDKVDDEPGTATFGATDRASGALLGVGTVLPERAPFDPAQAGVPSGAGDPAATWRLRWMATRHDVQGQGIGSMVLNAALDHVAARRWRPPLVQRAGRRHRLLRAGGLQHLGRCMGDT